MLVDRQQFDMGKAHVDGVRNELVREFVIAQKAAVLALAPRRQMNLIDRHGRAAGVVFFALGHVNGVAPPIGRVFRHDRRCRRPQLGRETQRIGLERQQTAVAAENFILIDRARADAGEENFPYAAIDALAHLRATTVPMVEVADD
jgi:hypothetical protein